MNARTSRSPDRWLDSYQAARRRYLREPQTLIELERHVRDLSLTALQHALPDIERGFAFGDSALRSMTANPPRQRGRKPTGQAVPWGEPVQNVILSNFQLQMARWSTTCCSPPAWSDPTRR